MSGRNEQTTKSDGREQTTKSYGKEPTIKSDGKEQTTKSDGKEQTKSDGKEQTTKSDAKMHKTKSEDKVQKTTKVRTARLEDVDELHVGERRQRVGQAQIRKPQAAEQRRHPRDGAGVGAGARHEGLRAGGSDGRHEGVRG